MELRYKRTRRRVAFLPSISSLLSTSNEEASYGSKDLDLQQQSYGIMSHLAFHTLVGKLRHRWNTRQRERTKGEVVGNSSIVISSFNPCHDV